MSDRSAPKVDPLDRRLNAYRSDLADIRLSGQVRANRYVEGARAQINIPVADLRPSPDVTASLEHQLLLGERVRVFERRSGWAWIQCDRDSYVGWTGEGALAEPGPPPTHRVWVPRTFIYDEPDLKMPARSALSMGSKVRSVETAERRGTVYAMLEDGGAIVERHLSLVDKNEDDFVSVARRLLHTPYLWGGSSAFGIDCSGLIELVMQMSGRQVLRDSDLQAATVGNEICAADANQRGDLVFWRGHVAIVEGDGNLLHANGYTMDVTSEPMDQALRRIETLFEKPILYRRP